MITPPNPFRFDREVSGDFFCGREADIQSILSHIHNGTNLIMFAKRRSGKSSLVKEIFENHLSESVLSAHIDIFTISTTRELYEYLKAGIETSLVDEETNLEKLSGLTQSLRGMFDNAEVKLTISSSPSLEIITTQRDYFKAITDLFNGYFAYLNRANQRAVIAIDEFQKILSLPEAEKIEALLRTIVNKRESVSFIFTGSKKNLLLSMFNDKNRPFYKLGMEYRLGKIAKEVLLAWAGERLKRKELLIDENAFDLLYEEAQGEPRFIQMALYALYEDKQPMSVINRGDMMQCIEEVIAHKSDFSLLFDTYSVTKQNTLKILAKTNGRDIYNKENLEAFEISSSSLQSTVKSLLKSGEIYEEGEVYTFEDVEFKMWLSRV